MQRPHKLRQILNGRWPWPAKPSLALGTLLLVVFLIFAGMWVWPSGNEATLVQKILPALRDTTRLAEAELPASETPLGAETEAERSPEESAGVASSNNTNSIYMPIVYDPLVLNPQTAAVEEPRGLVEVQSVGGTWTAVKRLATVTAGQRVRTGAYSGATLTFYDGSQATLGPDTEISLDQVDAQRPEDGSRTIVMTQWLGKSEHDVETRNDSGSRYELLTPNGSGLARGTTFQVLVSANLLTQIIVSEGQVDVTNLNVTVIVSAGQTTVVQPQQPPGEPHFFVSGEGEVTAIGETWTIGGQNFATIDGTVIVGNPQIGDIVSVSGYVLPDGTLVATHIILLHRALTNQFMLTGEVESIGANEWIVAGQAIAVNEETAVDETITVGDTVRVHGLILANGTLLAERIDLVGDIRSFEFVGVVENIAPDSWVISGVDIAVDENTEIKDQIAVGDVVKVEGLILTDNTWLAHEIKLADSEDRFEFTGPVNSIDPWVVSGISIQVDENTLVDDDVVVGSLVLVRGRILADGTWLATEIRLLADESLIFTFIGFVDSIDPWSVSGIPIEVDENTLVDDDVVVGSLVLVRGRILADGTWLATLIDRLGADDDPIGCYTITTIVISIIGNQLIVEGLPPITLPEDIDVDGDLTANAIISITVCVSQDGTIVIISIVIIHSPQPPPPPDDGDGQKVTICHIPPGNPSNRHTITVDWSAWVNAHQKHGDTLGPCP